MHFAVGSSWRDRATALVVVAAMGVESWAAPPSITGIGFLEPLDDSPATRYSTASGVSDDGSVAVGEQGWFSYSTYGVRRAVRWTRGGGLQDLGVFAGHTDSTASGVSADGRVVIGTSSFRQWAVPTRWRAFRWTAETGMRDIGSHPEGTFRVGSQAWATSANGSVVVGSNFGWLLGDSAFRWNALTGVVNLGSLPEDHFSQGTAVSGDGSVVVGESQRNDCVSAVRWTIEHGIEDLGTLVACYSWASGVSRDGRVVVGSSGMPPTAFRAFRWTRETGMVDLGPPTGTNNVYALAANDDGSVIVGRYDPDDGRDPCAFLWTASGGIVDLRDDLARRGVDVSEWTLFGANAISADGRFIAGDGFRRGEGEGWVVDLGVCEVDFDGDGFVTGADFDLYVLAFEAGEASADVDRDGFVSGADFDAFVMGLEEGC